MPIVGIKTGQWEMENGEWRMKNGERMGEARMIRPARRVRARSKAATMP
jgi:hypothetical protein